MNTKLRGFLIFFTSLFIIVALGLAGYQGYKSYKTNRFIGLGDESVEKGDWAVARYWYQNALDVDNTNNRAISQLCYYADFFRDPNTVEWWKQYVEIEPESQNVKLSYAEILMRHIHLDEAGEMLQSITPEPDLEARYANIYSAYYIATGDLAKAEQYARDAIEKNPDADQLKLNLLNILLRLGSPESVSEINQLLTTLNSKPENLPGVYRILLAYATGRGNWEEALKIAEDLVSLDDSRWDEKVAYLKLLVRFDPDAIPTYLSELKTPPPKLLEGICKVMIETNKAPLMLDWIQTLEDLKHQDNLSYQMCIVELDMALENWTAIIDTFKDQSWQFFNYYREAALSRAYEENGDQGASDRMWSKAQKEARNEGVQELIRLASIIETWPSYEPRWLELLEDMLQNEVYAQWSYNKLQTYYFNAGATRELYRVSQRVHKIRPNDDGIVNNMVMQGLLLGEDLNLQYERAKSLYEKHEGKPIPTSTYAFSLYKQGKAAEAYQLITSLDERYLDIAEIAHYAAVISKAAGHEDEAVKYLEKAKTANLLPEEKALLN